MGPPAQYLERQRCKHPSRQAHSLTPRLARLKLAQAVTIAVRYSVVRRQGFTGAAGEGSFAEHKVLDYTMQQYRLLPLLVRRTPPNHRPPELSNPSSR